MTKTLKALRRIRLISIITIVCLLPNFAFAQGEVVTSSELRDAIRKTSDERQKNLEQVRSFFADPKVKDALAKGGIQPDRVQKAVSSLDPADIAKLAAQTSKIQNDFAAGALTNQELTYIVIALATAVIVIILVKA
jgi:hypothetical protein